MRISARALIFFSFFFCTLAYCANQTKKNFTVQGYVLEMASTTQFEVDDYKVICRPETTVDIAQTDRAHLVVPYRPDVLHMGNEVLVVGDYDAGSGEIRATSIKVLSEPTDGKVSGMALIERAPEVKKTATGWAGTIFADGYRLRISPESEIKFTPAKAPETAVALSSLDQVGSNVWVAYSGVRADGQVHAERLAFSRNIVTARETKIRKKFSAKVIEPDYSARMPGKVSLYGMKDFEIVPDASLQRKINDFGMTLVPEYQRALSDSDPMKIKFRFYVVNGLKYWAVTAQDGSTFISSNVFLRLHNQAQLAGVIAAGIADVNQDHLYRMTGYRDWSNALCWSSLGMSWLPFVGLPLSAANAVVSNSASHYVGELSRQSGRLAVEYVMSAGYDGREVLTAFQTLSRNEKSGPKHPGIERTYFQNAATGASNELGQTYAGTDFSSLKTEAEIFDGLASQIQKPTATN